MGRKTLLDLVGTQKDHFKKLKEELSKTVHKINQQLSKKKKKTAQIQQKGEQEEATKENEEANNEEVKETPQLMRILDTPENKISIGVYMGSYFKTNPTFLGSYLFARRVSGLRVVGESSAKTVSNLEFKNYGSHCEEYPNLPYFTVAAAIGMQTEEINKFMERLYKGVLGLKKEGISQQ